jgi:hypothetical protein
MCCTFVVWWQVNGAVLVVDIYNCKNCCNVRRLDVDIIIIIIIIIKAFILRLLQKEHRRITTVSNKIDDQ